MAQHTSFVGMKSLNSMFKDRYVGDFRASFPVDGQDILLTFQCITEQGGAPPVLSECDEISFRVTSLALHCRCGLPLLLKGGLLRNLTKFLPAICSCGELRKLAIYKVSQQKGFRHLRPAP
jgi:hypothetical protein